MSLRIVDADLQLNQAFALFERTLKDWAGGRADDWRRDGPRGIVEEGATYARRDDVYVSVAMTDDAAAIAVCLMPGDQRVIEIVLPRRGPARDRRRAALAVDDNGETFLLIADETLRAEGVRDAFRRMAGHAQAKRARVGGRDYLMLGPLSDAGAPDALLGLAALHPTFEAHLDRLARLDAPAPKGLYRVADTLTRAHRCADKAAFAVCERLRAAQFDVIEARVGPFAADAAGRRDGALVAACALAQPDARGLAAALGALTIVAPRAEGWTRLLLAPAPREGGAGALAAYESAFAELGVTLGFYDIRDGEIALQAADMDPPPALRALWD